MVVIDLKKCLVINMKTNVTQSSIDSYYTNKANGNIGTWKHKIFTFIQNNPDCTRQDIENGGMKINIVCGRVAELKEDGLIEETEHIGSNGTLKSLYIDSDRGTVLKGHLMPSGVK